ncbi:MAG: sodium:solute symporter family transporter [Arsenophonus sp. NC-QC1-MAG3]
MVSSLPQATARYFSYKDSEEMYRGIIISTIIMVIIMLKIYLIGVLGLDIFTEFNDFISDDHNINDYSFTSLFTVEVFIWFNRCHYFNN